MIYSNVTEFKKDLNDKVVGVKLFIENVPNQQYIVSHLRLIDEYQSEGKTIAYCSSDDGRKDFFLSYPYRNGSIGSNHLPANANNEHVIGSGYNPPDYGYLCIHIGKDPISQVIGGLGLPLNRHVSFEIKFSKVGTVPVDPNPPTDSELMRKITYLENRVNRLYDYLLSFGDNE